MVLPATEYYCLHFLQVKIWSSLPFWVTAVRFWFLLNLCICWWLYWHCVHRVIISLERVGSLCWLLDLFGACPSSSCWKQWKMPFFAVYEWLGIQIMSIEYWFVIYACLEPKLCIPRNGNSLFYFTYIVNCIETCKIYDSVELV